MVVGDDGRKLLPVTHILLIKDTLTPANNFPLTLPTLEILAYQGVVAIQVKHLSNMWVQACTGKRVLDTIIVWTMQPHLP